MAYMSKKAREVCAMRDRGMTYEEIGKELGMTRQGAAWLAGPRNGVRMATLHQIKYIGLRNWMIENKVTVKALSKMCYNSHIGEVIKGNAGVKKDHIDAILKITGLTYEECFREE